LDYEIRIVVKPKKCVVIDVKSLSRQSYDPRKTLHNNFMDRMSGQK